MRDRESREPTTVLDHLRPTVVRRRVVVDVAALNPPKAERPSTTHLESPPERGSGCYPRASVAGDDEVAPPSSIMVPEGYEGLDDDETDSCAEEQDEDLVPSTRGPEPVEAGAPDEEDEEDEEEEPQEHEEDGGDRAEAAWTAPEVEAAPIPAPRPTIPVGPTIAVGTVAKLLGLTSAQVAAELVSRGFFEVTPATVLTRDTARIVAELFDHAIEEVAAPEPAKAKAPRKRTARRAAPAKRTAKTAKTKKRTGRSTRRAA